MLMGNGMTRLRFTWLAISIVALLFIAPANRAKGESRMVEFPVTPYMGDTITLTGKLTRPEGGGPFPALVFLHGCDGVLYDDVTFISIEHRMIAMGYVVLQVDSFGPRGITGVDGVCAGTDRLKGSPWVRARDAHAGKDYLANLTYVDGDRIAVIGWSHGGMTVLEAVRNHAINEPVRLRPFRAAIAFYPYCPLKLPGLDAPLLVLIGDADDWTRAVRCKEMTLEGDTTHEYYGGSRRVVRPGCEGRSWGYTVRPISFVEVDSTLIDGP